MRTTPLALASLSFLAFAACSPAATTSTNDATPSLVTIGWLLEDKGTDGTGMQTSHVALLVGTGDGINEVAIGDYAGCGAEEIPADGPLLTLQCWWAGGGDDFQVRMEGTNTLWIDHRSVDEQADIPEFAPLVSVTIPQGARLEAVSMKRI